MFASLNGKVASNIRIGLTWTSVAWAAWAGTPAFPSNGAVEEGQRSNQHEVVEFAEQLFSDVGRAQGID